MEGWMRRWLEIKEKKEFALENRKTWSFIGRSETDNSAVAIGGRNTFFHQILS
jgi:hypothetical protein